jgi:hypothetical protein
MRFYSRIEMFKNAHTVRLGVKGETTSLSSVKNMFAGNARA